MGVQCPYCDSISIMLFHGNTYRCKECGKLFAHYASEDLVSTV